MSELAKLEKSIQNCLPNEEIVESELSKLTKASVQKALLGLKDTNEDRHYYKEGKLHRTNGPAVESANGDKYYYKEGKLHRTGGPAVERANGDKYYFVNDKLHRTNGPAVEKNGSKEYFVNGKLHRTDGPAVERANGDKYYFVNDKLHRTNGPAVERADGAKAYFIGGKGLSSSEFNKTVKNLGTKETTTPLTASATTKEQPEVNKQLGSFEKAYKLQKSITKSYSTSSYLPVQKPLPGMLCLNLRKI